jgi:hypothetical protein
VTIAAQLESALHPLLGGPLPVRLAAWDGSTAGPADAPVVTLRSPRALRRILWHPGELGAAQAYVTGEIDVQGELADVLRLYLAGSALAFEQGRMGVDQILLRRPGISAAAAAGAGRAVAVR